MDRTLKKIIYAGICIIILFAIDTYVMVNVMQIQQLNDSKNASCGNYYDEAVASEIEAVIGETKGGSQLTTKAAVTPQSAAHTTKTFSWILILAVLDTPIILFFVLLYLATTPNEDGSKRKGLPAIIVGIVFCLLFAVFMGWVVFSALRLARQEAEREPIRVHAPVIYLYSESDEPVNISLDLNGEFTYTYPEYINGDGWTVTASPDGTLTDESGTTYEYIIWEADMYLEPDLFHGFCVNGSDTKAFLESSLKELGLNEKEISDFISYWLPKMENNPFNVISFQTTAFNDAAIYNVAPSPDVIVRVNMLWYASEEFVEIDEQDLADINCSVDKRYGLTFVEWGGEMIGE